jgi:8-oxo-dGTP pyrophosphatase MutT (NUDIX family)
LRSSGTHLQIRLLYLAGRLYPLLWNGDHSLDAGTGDFTKAEFDEGLYMTDYFLGAENVLSPSNATAAIISLSGKRYLMQLRDQKPNIFYPGHWGVFGGAIDPGETTSQGLQRELREELSLRDIAFNPFTSIAIDFSYCGLGNIVRHYFAAEIDESILERLRLGEGQEMRVFLASEILSMRRVVPYDSLAIWMHATKDDVRFTEPHP